MTEQYIKYLGEALSPEECRQYRALTDDLLDGRPPLQVLAMLSSPEIQEHYNRLALQKDPEKKAKLPQRT
jgi:hypothetical protein